MKTIPWIIAGIFFILFVVSTCTAPEDLSKKVIELEGGIERRNSLIHKLSRKDTERIHKQRQDSVVQSERVKSYQTKVENLTSQIVRIKAKPIVIKVREETPEIDSLITAQDSVITTMTAQIYEDGKYITQLQVEMSEIRRDFNERIAQQELNVIDQGKITEEYRKQLRKKRRSERLAKVLIPIVAALGIVGGSQL